MPTDTDKGAGRKSSSRRGGRNVENGHVDDEVAARRAVRNATGGDDGDGGDEVPELEGQVQLELPLAGGPLDMRVGGGRPTSSTFNLRSLSLPLAGQVLLDGKLWLLVEADADDVGVKSHRKGRVVTARTRHHTFTPLSARVLNEDELAQLGVEL